MFVIFGWEKTVKPEESLLTTHCYHCKNDSKWTLWKETEWISLFFINIFPFINNYYLSCDICGDAAKLEKQIAKKIRDPAKRDSDLHDKLIRDLEDHQFEGLSDTQRNYRKSQRENL